MARTKIEWTDDNARWNPVVGCTRASRGCDNCYAVVMSNRLDGMAKADRAAGRDPGKKANYEGLTVLNNRGDRHFNGTVRCVEDALTIPLGWKQPRVCFVNSMSDLFHKDVPFEFIDRVFAVMALCPQHTFQVLTKRPERMAKYLRTIADAGSESDIFDHLWDVAGCIVGGHAADKAFSAIEWPLPNVWLGTSVEDQDAADERIPHLLRCPAAIRFLSCEPLLGAVEMGPFLDGDDLSKCEKCGYVNHIDAFDCCGADEGKLFCNQCGAEGDHWATENDRIDWVIVGGESGKGARPCNIDWIRSIVSQCRDAGTACFVKQLGERPVMDEEAFYAETEPWRKSLLFAGRWKGQTDDGVIGFSGHNKKGDKPHEWPADLRVREMPEVAR